MISAEASRGSFIMHTLHVDRSRHNGCSPGFTGSHLDVSGQIGNPVGGFVFSSRPDSENRKK